MEPRLRRFFSLAATITGRGALSSFAFPAKPLLASSQAGAAKPAFYIASRTDEVIFGAFALGPSPDKRARAAKPWAADQFALRALRMALRCVSNPLFETVRVFFLLAPAVVVRCKTM